MSLEIIYHPKITLVARPQFIEPSSMLTKWNGEATDGERLVEFGGRLCYMSHHNPANRTTEEYIDNIKENSHGSVMEHSTYSLLIEGISRSCSHELVRHRLFGYSQVSQRYVDEGDTAFVIPPAIIGTSFEKDWIKEVHAARDCYQKLADELYVTYGDIENKVSRRKVAREAARSVLPNATETKILVTGNARAWRTMLELRCGLGAEREIRRMALECLTILKQEAPGIFNDFQIMILESVKVAIPIYKKI